MILNYWFLLSVLLQPIIIIYFTYFYCRLISFYFPCVTNNSITEFKLYKIKIQHIWNILKTNLRHEQYFIHVFLLQKNVFPAFSPSFYYAIGMCVGAYKYILNYNMTYYIVLYNHNYYNKQVYYNQNYLSAWLLVIKEISVGLKTVVLLTRHVLILPIIIIHAFTYSLLSIVVGFLMYYNSYS
jgi:hypothetical protein